MTPHIAKSVLTVEKPATRLRRILAYRWLLGLSAIVLVLDQVTKLWVQARLPFGTYGAPGAIPVIDDFFYLVHVGNTGAAWSMFSGRSLGLAIFAGITLLAIFVWRRALALQLRSVQISFGLLCGGIAGNLIDRIRCQHVIDFIDLHFGSYIYPTFNIADCGICVGVALYLWHSLRTPAVKAKA
ncbi:MAG: signal peptidase II [Opitutaceae bacterium]|nr:signal peptidase II [Opitutaceae bacterium]